MNNSVAAGSVPAHAHHPRQEHSVPWFWPLAAAIELGEEGMILLRDNLRFAACAEEIAAPPEPRWATPNHVRLQLPTMRLRDFSKPAHAATADPTQVPVLIDAPYAGHSSTIADYAPGQSLVEVLQANGLQHVLVTDWLGATQAMKDYDIDTYLADLNTAVEHLGGKVHLVGLCQGGWMSAMFAARFPGKVCSLVLAGAPIDTDADDGPIKRMAHTLPLRVYQELVDAGGGCMRGSSMLAGWKNMNPQEQYLGKYLDLYAHIEDKSYIKRTQTFEQWYENPIDLPGAFYLQVIQQLFKENRLARGEFVGLGQRLSLHDIVCPVYLIAGSEDTITTPGQVFGARQYLGTDPADVVMKLAAGGHIGLFMGTKTLAEIWPPVAHWIQSVAI